MTIDLRYFLPIVAFYAPGVMFLLGGLALGFSLDEMRHVVAVIGGATGFVLSLASLVAMDLINPIKVRLSK